MDFIIVPRSIFETDAFEKEPYSKREAFLDLVQMAAYERKDVFVSGHGYVAERGQLVVSQGYLAKKWQWSIGKVSRFLRYLERTKRCAISVDSITSISIVSYDSYQWNKSTEPTKKGKVDAEAVERIYNAYPPSVIRKDGNKVSLKTKKDKERIARILAKGTTEEKLLDTIKQYLSENPGAYIKMFSTFLNNLPEYEDNPTAQDGYEDF